MMIAVTPSSRRQSCMRATWLPRSINAFNNIGAEVRMPKRQLAIQRVENRSGQPRFTMRRIAGVAETRSLDRLAECLSGPLGEHTVNYYQTALRPSRVVVPSRDATWLIEPNLQQFHSYWRGHSLVRSVITAPAIRLVGRP
jgi:hypothetical protein